MTSTRDLVRIALFAALIAVLGLIPKFDLPFTAGVPITAQTMGVMLAGLFLGARNGFLAIMLFLFVVALGAPVLSGGRGGLGVFFGPTVGFLIGWAAGAWAVGEIYARMKRFQAERVFLNALIASLLGGIIPIYVFGISGLSLIASMPLEKAAMVSLIFVPGDMIKALLAAWLLSKMPQKIR
jgi:biotin transport system substrate-specific component